MLAPFVVIHFRRDPSHQLPLVDRAPHAFVRGAEVFEQHRFHLRRRALDAGFGHELGAPLTEHVGVDRELLGGREPIDHHDWLLGR